MTTPAVSVIMLCYNRAHFMRRAIESVLSQTFGDFEFIVMDHGSKTPEPFDIAKEYAAKDSRMRAFRVEENIGVSAGRTRLLSEARGEFVATIEDDDWWMLDKLEKQVAFLRANPEVGAFYCSSYNVDAKGDRIGDDDLFEGKTYPPTNAPVPSMPAYFNGSGQLFRRAALTTVGGWRPWFLHADDVDLFFRLEEKYHIHLSEQPLIYYRLHGANLTREWSRLYALTSWLSTHRRRVGKPDIIDGDPSVESAITRAADGLPPVMIRKAAKRLLLQKQYGTLRAFLAVNKKTGGGGRLKLFVKLAYWSLVNNRLGFLLSGLRSKYAFYTGMRGLMQIAIAKMTNRRQAVCFRHPLVRAPFYLRVPSSDAKVFRQVLIDGEYGDIPRLSKVTAIIDAGANTGITSCFFASRYPDAKIVALEPESGNFAMLKKNAAPYANIKAERAALWHKETTLRLSDPGLGEWGFITGEKGEGETAPALTVDGVMKKHGIERASILKVDIEGAEREVFANPSAWLERADMIVVETHDRLKPGCEATVAAALKGFCLRRNGELACYFRRDLIKGAK